MNSFFTVFLDESGHSGENYSDPSQPFYVCAGWVVETEKLQVFYQVVTSWEKEFNSKFEIKSSNILKRNDGISKISSVLHGLSKVAFPVYCVFEKRLGICAKFVESCFDPSYNPSVGKDFWNDPEARYNTAHDLYELLSDDDLNEFFEAVRSRNDQNVENAFAKVAEKIRLSTLKDISAIVDACPIDEAVRYLVFGNKNTSSVNYTALLATISKIEAFVRLCGCPNWDLNHDEIVQLEPHFVAMIEKFTKSNWSTYMADEFKAEIPTGPYSVNKVSFLKSSESPGIRAADYLAGTLRFILCERNELFAKKNEEIERLALLTFGPLIRKLHPQFAKDFPPLFQEVLSAHVGVEVIRLFLSEE